MSNFIFLKSDCPICGGIRNGKKKNDCKSSGELVHCFSHNDPPSGYVYRGESAIGQSLYAPDKGDDYDPEKHRAALAKLRAQHKAEQERKRLQLPTIGDRHQKILKFKAELTESQTADLLRRGLTEDEINFALSKHWLFAAKGGYGIAAVDSIFGKLCGAQRALNDRSQRKYDWNIFYQQNQLKETGENPLAVWQSPEFNPTKPYEIEFCEGYLKSLIRALVSWRKNPQIVVIGAAGGIFGKQSIKRLLSVYGGAERFTLLPDADSQNLKKLNLYSAYGNLARAVPSIRFADWGQWRDKTRGDCDEYFGRYKRRSPNQWLKYFEAEKKQNRKKSEVKAAIARFDITPHLVISDGEKYLPDGIIPTDKKIVGLKAPKGGGKSVQQGKHIDLIRSMGLIPVQLTHRRNLSSEKAKEWGLTYIESDAPAPSHFPQNGVSLVVDSCLKLKQIPNIPYERLVIFKDESEQILSHITDSDTAIEGNRAAVMDFIGTLLNRCHQVILADADLKTISIEWAKSLSGCGNDDVYLIEKKYKHNRTAVIFDDTPDLVVQLTQDLRAGDNCYSALSGQKVDSVLGSQNLEAYFQSIAKSQIRVDSDTNKDPSHPAYRIDKNLGILHDYQHALTTNTLGTGISINGNHFDGVYAIATGSNPVESFLQQPERVRSDATRYIAVSSVANGQSQKYGGVTSVSELMLITGKHGDAIRSHLKDFGDFGDDWLFNPWVRAWTERTCLNNHLGKDYLGSVVALMEADGYRIERRSLCTKEQRKEIRALLKGNAIEKTQQYISDILSSKALLGRELEASKAANDKTYPERCSEEHGTILELYGDDSEAIATAHITEHGFYKKLQLHFWLGQSIESVRERDKRKLHYLKKDSHGKLFPNDIRKICLTPKIVAIKKHRLGEVLTRGYIYSECPILNEFRDILQDENKRNEASSELGIGLDACPQKSIGSMGKWLLDNLFGLGIGDRRKQDGILIYPIESSDIPRDNIFRFWEENMITDELEQPDFAPAPMATANTPESTSENRSDSDQLIFFIGKSDPPSENLIHKDSQTTDHFFENTALNFSPPEITPPVTPAPQSSPELLGAVNTAIIALVQGDKAPMQALCNRLGNFAVIRKAAWELDQYFGGSGLVHALTRLWSFAPA